MWGLLSGLARWTVNRYLVGSSPTRGTKHFGSPPVPHDWAIKGIVQPCLSDLAYKDPVPLIEKRRGLSPGGRFPPSFIHQVIIITGPNKLCDCMPSPWRWHQTPTGRKPPTQKNLYTVSRETWRFGWPTSGGEELPESLHRFRVHGCLEELMASLDTLGARGLGHTKDRVVVVKDLDEGRVRPLLELRLTDILEEPVQIKQ